ncbi:MAG: glycoside hydrolase family 57 protein [Candidatus Coatesbacteria bacterium]
MSRPFCVALVWHMHQPDYRDPDTGVAVLPWVRLHAAKDYLFMAELASAHPKVRTTFNVTPVLADQLERLAGGGHDAYEQLSRKPAGTLTESETVFMLRHFFMVNWAQRIDPDPRYRELLDRRGRVMPDQVDPRAIERFSPQDLVDLAVLFNLAWLDDAVVERTPSLRDLRTRGRHFTEEDKIAVLEAQMGVLRAVIPAYRRLQDEGRLEVSTTPYFHPIGPLLIEQAAALEARPGTALPSRTFVGVRDAEWQLSEAVALHERLFGRKPAGLWPSEGGVSETFLRLVAQAGFRWAASDDGVLRESLRKQGSVAGPGVAYAPYRYTSGDSSISLLFRDHFISDMIGFAYARWDPKDAAGDFVAKLREAADRAEPGEAPPLVTVILDGENAWEHYPFNGRDFLTALYQTLGDDQGIRCVTPTGYLDEYPQRRALSRVHAGSWINHDFSIWIGHAEDRAAWEMIAMTRNALLERESAMSPDVFRDAWRSLMAAEGSDWTWWYGEDHYSPLAADFDRLFRMRLSRVYRLAGSPVPPLLDRPVRQEGARRSAFSAPADYVDIILDGRVSNYFEWLPAGRYDVTRSSSAMHRSDIYIEEVHFGVDRNGNLVLRLDYDPAHPPFAQAAVVVRVLEPVQGEGTFQLTAEGWRTSYQAAAPQGPVLDLKAACDTTFEAQVRLDLTGDRTSDRRFLILLKDIQTGKTLEQWPGEGSFLVRIPQQAGDGADWIV